jgi:hypothetical protein
LACSTAVVLLAEKERDRAYPIRFAIEIQTRSCSAGSAKEVGCGGGPGQEAYEE